MIPTTTHESIRYAGEIPPVSQLPLILNIYPRRRRLKRRRGRFLHFPEEQPGMWMFPKDDYSFLCGGGRC